MRHARAFPEGSRSHYTLKLGNIKIRALPQRDCFCAQKYCRVSINSTWKLLFHKYYRIYLGKTHLFTFVFYQIGFGIFLSVINSKIQRAFIQREQFYRDIMLAGLFASSFQLSRSISGDSYVLYNSYLVRFLSRRDANILQSTRQLGTLYLHRPHGTMTLKVPVSRVLFLCKVSYRTVEDQLVFSLRTQRSLSLYKVFWRLLHVILVKIITRASQMRYG